MTSPLLLIGASVRAAAQSARRAGFEPYAIDLFGDRDLRQIARVRVSTEYPDDLPAMAELFPQAPFLYTGALENAPEVLKQMCRNRTLWGNAPSVVERVRHPFRLQAFLAEASFPMIPLRTHEHPPADPDGWLVKPYRSAHGHGIRPASGEAVGDACYFQRLLPGVPIGAVFIADGQECRLIGTHRQLAGIPETALQPFRFCGAAAPARLSSDVTRTINQIGQSLVRWSGLTGLFGCDLIVNAEGVFLLEVNPRYTSAMELWEQLLGRSLIGDHVRVCRGGEGIPLELPNSLPDRINLKLILYAPQKTLVPPRLEEAVREISGAQLADLPGAGSSIDRDQPVCTLLVPGGSDFELCSAANAAIHSVGRVCGWNHERLESLTRDVSTRIAAEFT